MITGVHGIIPPDVFAISREARQFSPLVPGAPALEELADHALGSLAVLAPPGVLDRRYVLATALRALRPGGDLVVMAPKDRGGLRLAKELAAFGCAVDETARRHYRICQTVCPAAPNALDTAVAAGGPQMVPGLGLWSQPGIFSWDRLDAGTAFLLRHLPVLTGRGADFGCGMGMLARTVLLSADVTSLGLVDIDRRAIAAARRNVPDPRAEFLWRDVRDATAIPGGLDFVVMNPPFHDGGTEDRALGEAFIRRAAEVLRPGGVCWLVANRHLPYENSLKSVFAIARLVEQADGYKVYEARR